jgi:NADH-quinone oxidoreductase subunit L
MMGGLRHHLPLTYRTFLIGAIAIAGIPPLAGFFSKDEILWKVFSGGHTMLWLVGLVGAALTAFYMFRLVVLTFEGEKRWDASKHPHEAPLTMAVVLVILAVLSVVGGFVGVPASLGGGNAIEHWLEPVFAPAAGVLLAAPHGHDPVEYLLMGLSVAVAAGGIFLARRWYLTARRVPDDLARRWKPVYTLLLNKYYVDEIYDASVVRPLIGGSERLLWKRVDVGVIDWTVNALAAAVAWIGGTVRRIQTGVTESYMFVFLLGVVAILGWLLLL